MARPTAYDRQNSFRLFSAQFPASPHNGASLDTEFDAVKLSLDETQSNLAQIQDADGRIARGSIGRAQLDTSITLGVSPPASWETETDYDADVSVVFRNLVLYLCIEDHTSGVFQDDLNAGKWQVLADFSAATSVDDGSISTAKLADGAVTTSKLGSNSVSTAKILDSAVTTAKINDEAVTPEKLSDDAQALFWDTGDIKLTLRSTAPSGWRMFDDGTIGDASSGATYANAAAEALFELIFNNISDANAPILTSAGASTTRAAQTDAATAWAAHCRIALPKVLGRALAAAGSGSGLTARSLGDAVGLEEQAISQAQVPNYNLSLAGLTWSGSINGIPGGALQASSSGNEGVGANNPVISGGTPTTVTGSIGGTLPSGGSGAAYSKMQPSAFLNVMVKL